MLERSSTLFQHGVIELQNSTKIPAELFLLFHNACISNNLYLLLNEDQLQKQQNKHV